MTKVFYKGIIIFMLSIALISTYSCKDGNAVDNGSTKATSHNSAATNSNKGVTKTIDAKTFKDELTNNKYTLVDVRTPREFKSGSIPGAINIAYSRSFKNDILKLDKSKPVLIFCKSGARSRRAMSIMSKLGFKTVHDLKGGINSWKRAKY